jgi:hypothetical protein
VRDICRTRGSSVADDMDGSQAVDRVCDGIEMWCTAVGIKDSDGLAEVKTLLCYHTQDTISSSSWYLALPNR